MLGMNIGIDLGTTNTIVYVEGKGIVFSEPSAIAYDNETGSIMAVGKKAYDMFEKCPDSVRVIRPLENGVVSDFTATQHILKWFLKKILGFGIFKPNVIICTPSGVTGLEKRVILDLVTASGAGRACLMDEPLAAAIGAGFDVHDPEGIMIVDIGGGTTDIAVISMGNVIASESVRGAGNALDEAIRTYLKRERNIIVGRKTAEKIKKQIGCAMIRQDEVTILANGKDYVENLPTFFEVSSVEVFLAMSDELGKIVAAITKVLEEVSPDLMNDLTRNGICITGGGANIYGIAEYIEGQTGIKTYCAEDSLNCVAKGTGLAIKDMDYLENNGYVFKTREEIKGYNELDDLS